MSRHGQYSSLPDENKPAPSSIHPFIIAEFPGKESFMLQDLLLVYCLRYATTLAANVVL